MNNIRQSLKIEENRQLTYKSWKMILSGCSVKNPVPGQFVNIEIPGKYLRRPISVHWYSISESRLQIIYDTVGEGTRSLAEMKPGDCLDVLVGLGNGFSIPDNINRPVILGGGIGVAPLSQLAVALKEAGKKPVVIFCYNTKNDVIPGLNIPEELGIPIHIATVDGSEGIKGFFSDVIDKENLQFDYFYACGPTPMLKAVSNLPVPGQISMECRMGCGFGACMCCSLETKNGARRICKDGPVFLKEDVIWK